MNFKFHKKILCVIISVIFLLTSLNTTCATKHSRVEGAPSTEQSVELKSVSETDDEIIIEIEDKSEKEKTESETCIKTYSMRIVKTFETISMIMKIVGRASVYGGSAKIISETFWENQVLYFICAGFVIGILEPIAKKVYNIAKDNTPDKTK